ncbi:MAG: MBL fold metallo-hydrolase [Fimbriimonadaceae bacterium]|nr:MBL fold metallo-hydrolase [Fimbriimonadaceae bacterium]
MTRKVFLPVAALAVVGGLIYGTQEPDSPPKAVFLDVGQGDCTAITWRGEAILIDTGPTVARGWRRLLKRYGIRTVRAIFLTHPDRDHITGTGSLLREYPSAELYVRDAFRVHGEMAAYLREWGVGLTDVKWISAEGTREWGPWRLEFWLPEAPDSSPDNDRSLVISARIRDRSVWISGDLGISGEMRLLGRVASVGPAQIVKAGHHGSASSLSSQWLEALRPEFVVFSSGRENPYGHPHPAPIRRAEAVNATVYRTDRDGTVWFTWDGERFRPR